MSQGGRKEIDLHPESRYFAHSAEGVWPSAGSCLRSIWPMWGNGAAAFAEVFGGDGLASVGGQVHVLGKYTKKFQARLFGSLEAIDHSTAGARIVCERYERMGPTCWRTALPAITPAWPTDEARVSAPR